MYDLTAPPSDCITNAKMLGGVIMSIDKEVQSFLNYCQWEKNLDEKTVKAYRIDLLQFVAMCDCMKVVEVEEVKKNHLRLYLAELQKKYADKTVKRKLACVKSFFSYLKYEETIAENPFDGIRIAFKEKKVLPKMARLEQIERMLTYQYNKLEEGGLTSWERRYLLRDVTVIEVLFATGVRISELCHIRIEDIDFGDMSIHIMGKGAKERIVQIANKDIAGLLQAYVDEFSYDIANVGYVFVTKNSTRFSEQAARNMIKKYAIASGIHSRLTPHMFRHAFATYLLEEDVDIRYIQKLLGHSSISTTQIYCYVAIEKQKQILACKHPRNRMKL